jgi:amidophosphoribosyltransferase
MIGARDPLGIRPLVLGQIGDGWVLASETCALDMMGATFVRDVEHGEIVVIDDNGVESIKPFPARAARPCLFEYVYFSRPDSVVNGRSVYEVRKAMGRGLARELGVDADIVVPVPDSGVPAALGYAQESGIPYEMGIIRSHYLGRTFIQPSQGARQKGVRMKHSPNKSALAGKRVVLIDDSIVRGTTSLKLVRMPCARPAPPRSTCARPARRSCSPTSTASTCPSARSCWPPTRRWKRCARCWRSIRWASCPSTACIGDGRDRPQRPPPRSSPTTISPATIPPACWIARSRKAAGS